MPGTEPVETTRQTVIQVPERGLQSCATMRSVPRSAIRSRRGHLGCPLASGVQRSLASPWSPNGSHLAAASAPAEELIGTIGFQARHACSRWHFETLQYLSRLWIHAPDVAFVTFPGAVPELSIDPGNAGDNAIGLDGTKYRPCFRINLMDFPAPTLSNPECTLGPS